MKIVVIVAMRQEDDSAKTQAVEFDSIKNAGAFIADVFNQWPDDVACAVEVDGQSVEWRREGEKLFIGPPLEDDDTDAEGHDEELPYACDACGTMFRSPIVSIDKVSARTIYPEGDGLPGIDINNAYAVAQFCSENCRAAMRSKVYEHLDVRITNPGIGPVETCSRCEADIDMTEWHGDITESIVTFDGATLDIVSVAALCPACQSLGPNEPFWQVKLDQQRSA